MADSCRSPDICAWDPDEVYKAAHGACLPPRKRLLAGLKQNGWLPSSPPFPDRDSGASCATEELKLEVDLSETKHGCGGDDFSSKIPTRKQGECNTVEKLASVKSKRATKRRKSLSVLADCHGSSKNLQQPKILKSFSGVENQEKNRSNKASMEEEGVPAYKEMVDAARAAAAKAAMAAEEAKAIAVEKAAVAAKAAAIARAALEAIALATEDEVPECQPSRHVWASCLQIKIDPELKREFGSEPKGPSFPHLLLTDGVNTDALHPVVIDTVLDGINKEDTRIHSAQNSTLFLATAGVDTHFGKNEEAEKTRSSEIHTAACSMASPVDDEKLARQLHRAMNSSPRISCSRASLDYCRKNETSLSSTDQKIGGCSSSREKKKICKEKLRVSRAGNGKADIKVKSMIAINETLDMLQKATTTRYHVLGGTGSYFSASDEYADTLCRKEDDLMPDASSNAFKSLTTCSQEGVTLTGNCDVDGSHKFGFKAKGNSRHFSSYAHDSSAVGRDDEFRATKSSRIIKKPTPMPRRRKQTTGSILVSPQSRDDNRANESPSILAENQSDTPSNVVFEQAGTDPETSDDEDHEGRDENQDGIIVSGPGLIAGDDFNKMRTIKSIQEISCHYKSTKAMHKIHMSTHDERQKRGQKVLGVLANGLSEGNQIFGISMSSYMPSPTVL